MTDFKETSIDIIHGEKYCRVYTMKSSYMNTLRKYSSDGKDVTITMDDGETVMATVPANWFQFVKPPRKMNLTDEQRQERAERLRKAREKNV